MKVIYDAIIIGAGPAGSFCSYKMAKKGLKVLLVDASPTIKRKVCGEYLCPSGYQVLSEEGWGPTLDEMFLPINGMKIVSPEGTVLNTVFPKLSHQTKGLAVNRKSFDQFLVEKALEVGVTFLKDTRISSLDSTSIGWNVLDQKDNKFCARLVIGADGRNSFTAKKLKLSSKIDTSRIALHCHISSKDKNKRFGEMHLFNDGSYIGIDPIGNEETNFSLVCDSKRLGDFPNLHSLLNNYINSSSALKSSYGEIQESIKINTVAPITNSISNFTGKKFALIGDAAGFLDPLTGEGMYNALWTARSLSNQLASKGENSLFNFSAGIQNYARLKRRFFLQKSILNGIFQWVIKHPIASKILAKFLSKKQLRADIFVGIIGNIYRPLEGLYKLLRA